MKYLARIVESILIIALANYYSISKMTNDASFIWGLLLLFVVINITPHLFFNRLKSRRLKICADGCELLIIFLISTVGTSIYSLVGFVGMTPLDSVIGNPKLWIINTLIAILVEAIVFWNGIIRVYLLSVQLGIKIRVIGIVCGWIPVANLIALHTIIKTVTKEVTFENEKILVNEARKAEQICKTKYPLLLVHGVFFRDYKYLNYWGRIPGELEKNGATIFYGNHQSAASVADSGEELSERIKQILKETGAEKVNIIAHSKGGLDSRYAISILGMAPYVASLTTINTPHRGCEFADYLLSKIGKKQQQMVADTYNSVLRKCGDDNPDFMAAVSDLTASSCEAFNKNIYDMEGVYYQSIGSKLNVARSGKFPLNFTYHLVKYFDGANDGLVGEQSFVWGEDFQFLTVNGKRGISHGDMIDLNRENLEEFDVREFYVQLVSQLKNKGM